MSPLFSTSRLVHLLRVGTAGPATTKQDKACVNEMENRRIPMENSAKVASDAGRTVDASVARPCQVGQTHEEKENGCAQRAIRRGARAQQRVQQARGHPAGDVAAALDSCRESEEEGKPARGRWRSHDDLHRDAGEAGDDGAEPQPQHRRCSSDGDGTATASRKATGSGRARAMSAASATSGATAAAAAAASTVSAGSIRARLSKAAPVAPPSPAAVPRGRAASMPSFHQALRERLEGAACDYVHPTHEDKRAYLRLVNGLEDNDIFEHVRLCNNPWCEYGGQCSAYRRNVFHKSLQMFRYYQLRESNGDRLGVGEFELKAKADDLLYRLLFFVPRGATPPAAAAATRAHQQYQKRLQLDKQLLGGCDEEGDPRVGVSGSPPPSYDSLRAPMGAAGNSDEQQQQQQPPPLPLGHTSSFGDFRLVMEQHRTDSLAEEKFRPHPMHAAMAAAAAAAKEAMSPPPSYEAASVSCKARAHQAAAAAVGGVGGPPRAFV